MNLKELAKRLMVAAVAIPLVCFCVFFPIFMNIVTTTLSYVGTLEWVMMRRHLIDNLLLMKSGSNQTRKELPLPLKPTHFNAQIQLHLRGLFAAVIPAIAYIYYDRPFYVLASLIVIYVFMFMGTIFGLINSGMMTEQSQQQQQQQQQGAMIDMIALTLDYYGIIYVGLNLSMAILILRNNPMLLLLILFANWAADAFAMFAGKNLGKHKLCPTLSPNKTVEGAIGAVIGAVLLSLAVRFISLQFHLFPHTNIGSNSTFIFNGVLLGVLGVVGDLLESFYKRVAGIKDSGDFFRAHGGVLDRIDGLLFSFPIMYIVSQLGYF